MESRKKNGICSKFEPDKDGICHNIINPTHVTFIGCTPMYLRDFIPVLDDNICIPENSELECEIIKHDGIPEGFCPFGFIENALKERKIAEEMAKKRDEAQKRNKEKWVKYYTDLANNKNPEKPDKANL